MKNKSRQGRVGAGPKSTASVSKYTQPTLRSHWLVSVAHPCFFSNHSQASHSQPLSARTFDDAPARNHSAYSCKQIRFRLFLSWEGNSARGKREARQGKGDKTWLCLLAIHRRRDAWLAHLSCWSWCVVSEVGHFCDKSQVLRMKAAVDGCLSTYRCSCSSVGRGAEG
jgi:hypothetical protein